VQGNNFYYLDPHSTRPLLPYHAPSAAADSQTHPSTLTASSSSTSSAASSITIVPPTDSLPAASSYSASDIANCHTRRIRRLQIREMDPSVLLAFLVTSEADYDHWKEGVLSVQGKCVVHVQDKEPAPRGQEREGAVDEVESWDEEGLL
jgi:cysteine protease ATG4